MNNTTVMTIPTINQLDRRPHAVRDFAKAQGLFLSSSKYEIDGTEQRGGYVLSRVADDDEFVQVRDFGGGDYWSGAGGRYAAGVAPRFEDQNPNSQISTSGASGAEKFLNFQGRVLEINENGHLTIDGNIAYFPNKRIGGQIEKVEGTGLEFTTDKTPLDWDNYKNTPYEAQPNETYNVNVDGHNGYATEVSGTKVADSDSIYNDGTRVTDGGTEMFALEPIPAKWDGNAIQVTEVLTVIQLEPQNEYEKRGFTNGDMLPIDELQIGRVMAEYLFPEMVKGAEFAPVIEGEMSLADWKVMQAEQEEALATAFAGVDNEIDQLQI